MKNTNSDLYKDLFRRASEVLSGYERTQTFDEDEQYFYKDSSNNSFVEFVFQSDNKEDKINEFANALTIYTYLYVKNGKDPNKYNFVPELGITTLEEYYNWLPEIKKDKEGKPTVFTKLPLDEAHFEINANTRAISIPAEFKKNGIAVQGDDLAEVVYFMIDRYFDAMDLNNTEIYIEWETPKGKDGTVTKSISETYLKMIDDANYPGKLIFGWAISDAITKDSGTLKFSVRFVQWNDENKLVYSFNTLTAQVAIHPNLGLNLEEDSYTIDNCNDRLLERIKESEVVGGIKAAIPYFLTNLEILEEGYDIVDNHKNGTYDLSVVATADDTGMVSYIWQRADLDEYNESDDAWFEIADSSEVSMIQLTEEELNGFDMVLPEDHIYHLDRTDGTFILLEKPYYNLNDINTKTFFKDEYNVDIDAGELPEIYEQRSILTVEKYGKYRAEARNRIFNSMTKTKSNIAVFGRPDFIVMDNKNQTFDKHILGTESATLSPVIVEAVGDLDYQWCKGEGTLTVLEDYVVADLPANTKVSYGEDHIRVYVPESTDFGHQEVGEGGNSNKYYVTLKSYIPEGAVSTQSGFYGELGDVEQLAETFTAEDERGWYKPDYFHVAVYDTTTKVWVHAGKDSTLEKYEGFDYVSKFYDKDGNVIKEDAIRIDLANKDCWQELKVYEPIEGEEAQQQSYTATEPGFYQLKVIRTRNRAETEGQSLEYRVTNAPAVPVYTADTYDALEIIHRNDLYSGDKVLTINWETDIESDEFYVTWYLYRGGKDLPDLELDTFKMSDIYTSSFNPTEPKYKSKFEEAGENIEAYYYATVKNKLNGVISAASYVPEQEKMFSVDA